MSEFNDYVAYRDKVVSEDYIYDVDTQTILHQESIAENIPMNSERYVKIRYSLKFNVDEDNDGNIQGDGKYLVFFCLNPSTADKLISDSTVDELVLITLLNNFDGFILFNLSPIRITNLKKLQKEPENFPAIIKMQEHNIVDTDNKTFNLDKIIETNYNKVTNYLEKNKNKIKYTIKAWGSTYLKKSLIGINTGYNLFKEYFDTHSELIPDQLQLGNINLERGLDKNYHPLEYKNPRPSRIKLNSRLNVRD